MAAITLPNGKVANLTVNSILINASELREGTVDAIRNACVDAAVQKAVDLFGPEQALTVRDLNALDMDLDYNWFHETSSSSNQQWNAIVQGEITVANGSVMGIYGCGFTWLHDATIDQCPVSAYRIDVGGARVAQWALQQLDDFTSAASTGAMQHHFGVTKSPIIVGEDITVTIYEYTRVASKAYDCVWLGVIVEKEGKTLKP